MIIIKTSAKHIILAIACIVEFVGGSAGKTRPQNDAICVESTLNYSLTLGGSNLASWVSDINVTDK